jgi:hypothetical protein
MMWQNQYKTQGQYQFSVGLKMPDEKCEWLAPLQKNKVIM